MVLTLHSYQWCLPDRREAGIACVAQIGSVTSDGPAPLLEKKEIVSCRDGQGQPPEIRNDRLTT